MAEFTFDATQVEPNTEFEIIPADKYHVQIVNSEMRDTKNGNGKYLWMELNIIDGPYADRHLFERLNLRNPNEKAVEIAQRQLSAICRAIGQLDIRNTEQLHHRSMIADVRIRPAGPDKGGIMRNAQNEIAGYLPMSGAIQPAAQAWSAPARPAQAAQAAPAAQATPQPTTPPWRRAATA